VVKRAEAACELAKKARDAAESALKEYNEETIKKELEEAKGDIARSKQDLADASDRVNLALRIYQQVKISKESRVVEELGFQKPSTPSSLRRLS